MLKILYVDGVGPAGGSSRSLFEMVKILRDDYAVEPYFVAARGTALDSYEQVAKDIIATRELTRFDNTRYSYYRGVRWLVLLRELFHFPFTIMSMLKAKRTWGSVDVIHVNEITEIIPAIIAKLLFKAPLLVHVRSLQRIDAPSSIRTRLVNWSLSRYADAVVAINENTAATLPSHIKVEIIRDAFTAKKLPTPDETILRKLQGLRSTSLKVGFVGNLHHSKGLFDLLNAAHLLAQTGRDIEFVIVGGVTIPDKGIKAWLLNIMGLAQDVESQVRTEINKLNLQKTFHLLGPTDDIQSVYEVLDVICFPSHYDAPGRPVFEAAFSGAPSIVSVSKPRADTLIDGETGIAIPAQDPQKLADAIAYFADNPTELARMGGNAQDLANRNFSPAEIAKELLSIYARLISSLKTS